MRSKLYQIAAALVVSGAMSGLCAAEPGNLFPPVGRITIPKDGGWYTNRTAGITARHTHDEAARALSLETKGASGYADWRCNVSLAPGAYTVAARFSGQSTDGRFSIAAYSFGAEKPRLLGSLPLPSGVLEERLILMHIKVPEGSKFVRFDFTSSKSGNIRIVDPVLYAGRLSAEKLEQELKKSLPGRDGSSSAGKPQKEK